MYQTKHADGCVLRGCGINRLSPHICDLTIRRVMSRGLSLQPRIISEEMSSSSLLCRLSARIENCFLEASVGVSDRCQEAMKRRLRVLANPASFANIHRSASSFLEYTIHFFLKPRMMEERGILR